MIACCIVLFYFPLRSPLTCFQGRDQHSRLIISHLTFENDYLPTGASQSITYHQATDREGGSECEGIEFYCHLLFIAYANIFYHISRPNN